MTLTAVMWLIGLVVSFNVSFYYLIRLIRKELLSTKGDKAATIFIATFFSLIVFSVVGVLGSGRYSTNVMEPTYVQMRLVTGDLICSRYIIPADRPNIGIGTYRGSYYATYAERGTIFWGSFTTISRNTLKNGVVDANIVDHC